MSSLTDDLAPHLQKALGKAETLIEALPWLQRFTGSIVVVKYGGNAMINPELQAAFAADMVFLHYVGIKPVVVHGGGPQISSMLKKLNIASEFKGGLRVTTPEAADVVRMVLVGQVGINDSNGAEAPRMAQAASLAVIRCAPLKLPPEHYGKIWRAFELTFSPVVRV